MARTYAQIYLTIWNDPDFRNTSTDAQWLYFLMLTHPTLTSCGVMDWRPARLIAMSEGMTIPRLQQAAWELGQKNLIAVAPETEEALVRSFVRHDGILKSPNKTKALVREYGAIASQKLMALVSREVRRAGEEDPNLKGFLNAESVAKQFPEPLPKGFEMVPEWFQNSSKTVQFQDPQKQGKGSKSVPPPSSLIPHPSTDVERAANAATQPNQKRGTRIDPNYQPPATVIQSIARDYPDYDTKAEHPNFIDYWLGVSGAKGVKRDWDATWRKWMRTNAQRAQQRAGPRMDRATATYLADAQRYATQEQNAEGLIPIAISQ